MHLNMLLFGFVSNFLFDCPVTKLWCLYILSLFRLRWGHVEYVALRLLSNNKNATVDIFILVKQPGLKCQKERQLKLKMEEKMQLGWSSAWMLLCLTAAIERGLKWNQLLLYIYAANRHVRISSTVVTHRSVS
jgi:hypothetical protein